MTEEKENTRVEESGSSAHDLGVERPGIDDENYNTLDIDETSISASLMDEPKNFNNPIRVRGKRVFGRNDFCPCGSGRKIKKCHTDLL